MRTKHARACHDFIVDYNLACVEWLKKRVSPKFQQDLLMDLVGACTQQTTLDDFDTSEAPTAFVNEGICKKLHLLVLRFTELAFRTQTAPHTDADPTKTAPLILSTPLTDSGPQPLPCVTSFVFGHPSH